MLMLPGVGAMESTSPPPIGPTDCVEAVPELIFEIDDSGPRRRRVLRLRGELDLATSRRAVQAIRHAGAARSRLWVDLSGVSFCDVVGATALECAESRLAEKNCRLTLLGAEQALGPMLALDGLFPRLRAACHSEGRRRFRGRDAEQGSASAW
jgi:anti-anti-sigma factor